MAPISIIGAPAHSPTHALATCRAHPLPCTQSPKPHTRSSWPAKPARKELLTPPLPRPQTTPPLLAFAGHFFLWSKYTFIRSLPPTAPAAALARRVCLPKIIFPVQFHSVNYQVTPQHPFHLLPFFARRWEGGGFGLVGSWRTFAPGMASWKSGSANYVRATYKREVKRRWGVLVRDVREWVPRGCGRRRARRVRRQGDVVPLWYQSTSMPCVCAARVSFLCVYPMRLPPRPQVYVRKRPHMDYVMNKVSQWLETTCSPSRCYRANGVEGW